MEVQEGSEEEREEEEGKDTGEEEGDDVKPQISVHAINGIASRGYRTMRVKVYVNKRLSIFL